MIRHINGKYFLYTHDGSRSLGGPYDTLAQAEKREAQVNYFKHRGEK